jgi:hypothetical protein
VFRQGSDRSLLSPIEIHLTNDERAELERVARLQTVPYREAPPGRGGAPGHGGMTASLTGDGNLRRCPEETAFVRRRCAPATNGGGTAP